MNCNTCRFELSQCLDGRLPSGRRATVLQHVDDCAPCAEYWAEMQAAQQLVLRLPSHRVGGDFRDRLWARIQAGEGTPDAVFREPVSLLTKARYALTGAAAAAAVLLAALWLRDEGNPTVETPIAQVDLGTPPDLGGGDPNANRLERRIAPSPATIELTGAPTFVSAAQPLTSDLVAVEAAKQFQQRFLDANQAIQRLTLEPADGAALRRAFESADELRGYGHVLLTLRDRDRLSFRDVDVDADLRVAVNMLDARRLQKRNVDTVRSVVAPALASKHLGNLVRTLRVQPSIDPSEETEVLWRLNLMQPEAFERMFFVMGDPNEVCESFGLPRRPEVFLFEGQCGPQWVAPRSAVQRFEVQILRRSAPSQPGGDARR